MIPKAFVVLAIVSALDSRVVVAADPGLEIEIRDYASVPRTVMTQAVAELRQIFARSDIPIVVHVDRRSRNAADFRRPEVTASVVVQLVSRREDTLIAADPDVLGLVPGATRGGRLAYVFPDRVEIAARRAGALPGPLLGAILAHEIGHVVLPGRPHAADGVMRAACDARQARNMTSGHLAFSRDETASIRHQLSSWSKPSR